MTTSTTSRTGGCAIIKFGYIPIKLSTLVIPATNATPWMTFLNVSVLSGGAKAPMPCNRKKKAIHQALTVAI